MKSEALRELLAVMEKWNLRFDITYAHPDCTYPQLDVDWEEDGEYRNISLWEAELRCGKLAYLIEQGEEERDEALHR